MKKRNVLVLGGGGREHALCWKLSKSSHLKSLHCIPGNAGIAQTAHCNAMIPLSDFNAIKQYTSLHNIDLIVVGPEQPLVNGIKDFFEDSGIDIFGPDKNAAQLEGSKIFTKNLFSKYNIPTPSYHTFFSLDDALYHIHTQNHYPKVIKADGLAAGKGVIIAQNEEHAASSIKEMMELKKFQSAGEKIVIEEFIKGNELSYQIILNGSSYVELKPSQDFKKVHAHDQGPNTGGMGNLCPPSWADDAKLEIARENIIHKLVRCIQEEGIHFSGVLFTGLIMSDHEPKALEINVRFGDPEIQSILPLLKTDLLEIIISCIENRLDQISLEWTEQYSSCIVLASRGYPDGKLSLGHCIEGLDQAQSKQDVIIFHAGTQLIEGNIVNSGGRVLNVVGLGKNREEASKKAYETAKQINFEGMQYRKDIR